MENNVGYCGAVSNLLQRSDSEWRREDEFIAYCDNDVEIRTTGWDQKLIAVMQEHAEVGWVFPGPGHFGFDSNGYRECLWSAGYCWIIRRDAVLDVAKRRPAIPPPGFMEKFVCPGMDDPGGSCPYFNAFLGHHEEVEYMLRLRMCGWRIGCCPDVQVIHHETATRADSADHKPGGRIHDGVVRWMNWHNMMFCGDNLQYSMTAYDPRALRYTDWWPDALYLERMTLALVPGWNTAASTAVAVDEKGQPINGEDGKPIPVAREPLIVNVPGVGLMHAVTVLKPLGPYRGRAI
jgi:hypothetical protein